MNRREFFAAGIGGAMALPSVARGEELPKSTNSGTDLGSRVRAQFPRLERDVFLNAAAGTPLGRFAEAGLRRFEDSWRYGRGEGRGDYAAEMLAEIRGLFARLIGARSSEIGFVHCTKAGEQIVLDGLPALRIGSHGAAGNVVTNDLHFAGSLHNLIGLRKSGLDVRIVRSQQWDVPLEAMKEAIDERTALVTVTLVSNVNGRIEPLAELCEIAHAHGAYVFADIIQAAGIVPIDVRASGVDFAACSGYKWLLGPHGVGFFFVREELQGTALVDRLFPGHARHNYRPWTEDPDETGEDFLFRPPSDARRYQPGHVSYLGYCALYEGLKFLESVGVETALGHSVRLARRLVDRLDPDRYPCISPHLDRSPIVTFLPKTDFGELEERLRSSRLVVSLGADRLRVSPAVYNIEGDVDLLAEVLNRSPTSRAHDLRESIDDRPSSSAPRGV